MVKTGGETRNVFPFKLPLTLELVQQSHSCILGYLLLFLWYVQVFVNKNIKTAKN